MASATLSKSKRFNEIFHILLTHDVASLLRDLASYARNRHAAEGLGTNGAQRVPARVREVLESLGPTFIKIGQLLGTRPDLIPQPFIEEFKKLYDQTNPTPYADVKIVLEKELGQSVEAVFQSFEQRAI